jgi:hypothetical protein
VHRRARRAGRGDGHVDDGGLAGVLPLRLGR